MKKITELTSFHYTELTSMYHMTGTVLTVITRILQEEINAIVVSNKKIRTAN